MHKVTVWYNKALNVKGESMKLPQLLEKAHYKVSEGSAFLWTCFGQNCRNIVCSDEDLDVEMDVVYDCLTAEVYTASISFSARENMRVYRWINPTYQEAYFNEYFERDLDPRQYVDDIQYMECEIEDDFVNKVTDAFETGTTDNTIVVSLELDSTSEMLTIEALGDTNGSLEQLVEVALQDAVNKASAKITSMMDKTTRKLRKKGVELSFEDMNPVTHRYLLQMAEPSNKQEYKSFKKWILSVAKEGAVILKVNDRLTRTGLKIILTNSLGENEVESSSYELSW